MEKLIRPTNKTLAEQMMESISRDIDHGLLKVGERLPTEITLMAQYGVSRTVVREAISRLQASQIVETKHGIGTFIKLKPSEATHDLSNISVSTKNDMYDLLVLRRTLEKDAAILACQNRTAAQLNEIEIALQKLKRSKSAEESIRRDFEFHYSIIRASNNGYFQMLYKKLRRAAIPRTRVSIELKNKDDFSKLMHKINIEHQAIFEAITLQDTIAAQSAIEKHFETSITGLNMDKKKGGLPPFDLN